MFFAESARLADRHPDLADTIEKIDTQLASMEGPAVIRPAEFATFVRADRHQVGSVLDLLAETGILHAQEMLECEFCEMPVLRSDYEAVIEEEDEYRCTSCNRPWEDGPGAVIMTYGRGEKWKQQPRPMVSRVGADKVPGIAQETGTDGQPQSTYCRVITRSGKSTLTRSEYEDLVRHRDEYAMFIDAMTRQATCCHENGKPRLVKLTAREAGMLVDVIQAGKPVRPHATKTGGACASPEAASRLFEEARRKADVRLGRYEFRAFRTHRSPSNRSLKTFEFAPPGELEYCVIVPA